MDLSRFDVAITDSVEALRVARVAGLRADAEILSTAPAVLVAEPAARDIERRVPRETVDRFIAAVGQFSATLAQELRADRDLSPYANAAACGAFYGHRLLHKALMLTAADFARPMLVLQPRTGNVRVDRVIASPWIELLRANRELVVHECPVALPEFGRSFGGAPPGLLARLPRLRLGRLAYRLLVRIGRRLPAARPGRPDVLIMKDSNELVRDTALAFAWRGHRLARIESPALTEAPLVENQVATLDATMGRLFDKIYGPLFAPCLHAELVEKLRSTVRAELTQAQAAARHWENALARYRGEPGRPKAVLLHGAPLGGAAAGLHLAARRLGIPLIGFQHGVRREIAAWPLDVRVLNENNFADSLLCYNAAGALYCAKGSPYALGPADPVGMPSDYKPRRGRRPDRAAAPLLYVSTLLYRGGMQISNTALSDHGRALRESRIVNEVLVQLPHRLRYKPYPSIRYADPDPVIEAVRRAPNIELFLDETDMRYMLLQHRVAITGGATSTVGWCALSDRPLVFIDDAEAQPLNADARALFADAYFVFDARQPDFHAALRDFLSQPVAEIEAQAAEKRRRRRADVHAYLGLTMRHAGLTAREFIRRGLAAAQAAA